MCEWQMKEMKPTSSIGYSLLFALSLKQDGAVMAGQFGADTGIDSWSITMFPCVRLSRILFRWTFQSAPSEASPSSSHPRCGLAVLSIKILEAGLGDFS